MKILLVTILVLVLTFLYMLAFNKKIKNKHLALGQYKVHHSVLGLLLLIIGVVINNFFVLSAGLGLYLAHGLEEMYFNHTVVYKAFFIFITRE